MMAHGKQREPRHYILVCTDGSDADGRRIPAKEIAAARLRAGEWPLYKGTGYRSQMVSGDTCLVYVAGSGELAQCFVGAAQISHVTEVPKNWREPIRTLIGDPAARVAALTDVTIWDDAVSIRRLIPELAFIKNKRLWGLHLIGGVKVIPDRDFLLVSDAGRRASVF